MILAWGLFLYGMFVVVVRLYFNLIKGKTEDVADLLFGAFIALCSAQYIWG